MVHNCETCNPTEVRWRRPPRLRWTYGKLLHIQSVTVTVMEWYSGNVREIEKEYVEVRQRGPRGGKGKWVSFAS